MAANDDKRFELPLVSPLVKEQFLQNPHVWLSNTFTIVNDILRKMQATSHTLEGRNGKISLRDSVGVYGGVSVGTTYTTSDAPTSGMLVEGKLGVGTTDPKTSIDVMNSDTGSVAKEVLALSRQRGDTGGPGADFGAYMTWRLEGFTNNTNIVAAKILGAWDKAQTNNTTDQDAYIAFSVALDGALTETARITSSGITTTVAFIIGGPHGETETWGYTTELITVAAAGFTDSTANLLPANSIIRSVVARVTVVIPTAVTFRLGDPTTTRRFSATDTSTAATTTVIGITQHAGSVTTDAAGPTQPAADKVRLTMNGGVPVNNSGRVRVTVFYNLFGAPTS